MDRLIENLRDLLTDALGDQLDFAVIFGSRARGEATDHSDVDVMIVIKRPFVSEEDKEGIKKRLIDFYRSQGILVDDEYPVEVITRWTLTKAISGFGFVHSGSAVAIAKIYRQDWNEFNEHRQWLCAMATPSLFIAGDEKHCLDCTHDALRTVVSLCLLNDGNIDSVAGLQAKLISEGKEYLGFYETPAMRHHLSEQLPLIIDDLSERGMVRRDVDKLTLEHAKAIAFLSGLTEQQDLDLRNKFLGPQSSHAEAINLFDEIIKMGTDFVMQEKVLEDTNSRDVIARLTGSIPARGISMSELLDEMAKNVVAGSIHQASGNYLAFPDAGNSKAAIAGAVLSNFLNQNLVAVAKSAPVGTFLEIEVLRWLRELIGYQGSTAFPKEVFDVGGMMTTGGTMANTVAMLAARERAYPACRQDGFDGTGPKPILLVAGNGLNHYSHVSSFWWLGMGENNVINVKVGPDFRLDCNDLESKLKQYGGQKHKVVAIIAQAGDSRTMTCDHFMRLAEIAHTHGVWLHVDACHGGTLLFSKKFRDKLSGIEMADSVSLDPHKGLGCPYSTSAVLFRDAETCKRFAKSSDITIQGGTFDLGQTTAFLGSRPFDSLKLWCLIKHLGTDGISTLVDYRFGLAEAWREKVIQSRFFTPLNQVEINSVVFSVSPAKLEAHRPGFHLDGQALSKLNQAVHDRAYREGFLCVHSFNFTIDATLGVEAGSCRVMGVTFGNPATFKEDFPAYFAYLDDLARDAVAAL
jgi:L-2,4-diaminobutyrate decarboxylase